MYQLKDVSQPSCQNQPASDFLHTDQLVDSFTEISKQLNTERGPCHKLGYHDNLFIGWKQVNKYPFTRKLMESALPVAGEVFGSTIPPEEFRSVSISNMSASLGKMYPIIYFYNDRGEKDQVQLQVSIETETRRWGVYCWLVLNHSGSAQVDSYEDYKRG